MRSCVGEVSVLERVIVMIFNIIPAGIFRKWPKAIQVDLITEARGNGVHQQSCARTLDIDLVCEPVPENI